MPKKPKLEEETKPARGDWADDQKEHEYYYDDAHGYEEYNPDKEDESDEPAGGGDNAKDR